mgnify:CR=1 FL=1
MPPLVLIKISQKSNKPVLPLTHVFNDVTVQPLQLVSICKICLILLRLVLRVMLGYIQILKLHSLVSPNFVLYLLSLINKLVQSIIIILNHILLLLSLLLLPLL